MPEIRAAWGDGHSVRRPPTRVLAFGEIMLRLSPPGRELLLQTNKLDIWVGGAEANVAAQLAKLSHDVGLVSRVPDNDLGRAAVALLRGHGVDVGGIQLAGERMGLYFATAGAGMRAGEVLYDRAHSSFALAPDDAWDWDALLEGVGRLHLSGITPALGATAAAATLRAAETARARGVRVSFDGNWRGKLWARWDSEPRAILTELVDHADLLFGDHRDIALLLGREPWGNDAHHGREAAEAAFAAYPRLETIASTARRICSADCHYLSARVDMRGQEGRTKEVTLAGIVDRIRIGAGDAFAAGVLHAQLGGGDATAMAETGLALAALKHSLPGDANLFRQTDLQGWLAGELDVRR